MQELCAIAFIMFSLLTDVSPRVIIYGTTFHVSHTHYHDNELYSGVKILKYNSTIAIPKGITTATRAAKSFILANKGRDVKNPSSIARCSSCFSLTLPSSCFSLTPPSSCFSLILANFSCLPVTNSYRNLAGPKESVFTRSGKNDSEIPSITLSFFSRGRVLIFE